MVTSKSRLVSYLCLFKLLASNAILQLLPNKNMDGGSTYGGEFISGNNNYLCILPLIIGEFLSQTKAVLF